MLRLYRRHRLSCTQTSEKYRRCSCPIYVEGSLAGEHIRKSIDLTSWEAASTLIAGWNAAGEIGNAKTEIPTLSEAVQKFLADATVRMKEPSVKKYRNILENHLLGYARKHNLVRLKQLNAEALRAFREGWKFAPRTHQKNLEFLRCFFRFCVDSDWLPKNPAAKIQAPTVADVPTLPFSDKEIAALLTACSDFLGKGDRLRAIILVMRYAGLRISDAVALRRERIQGNRIFLYQQKTGTPVNVPVPRFVIDSLEKLPGKDYVFWSGNGKPQSAIGNYCRGFTSLAKRARVKKAHFHRLRDTFAVELLLAGVPIEDVSILLGHSNTRITARHYSPWVRARQIKLEERVKQAWALSA